MRFLAKGLVIICSCFMVVSISEAKGPASDLGPGNSANTRAKVRPQIRQNRLIDQATPRGLSPAPGRAKAMERAVPGQRLARRLSDHREKTSDTDETTLNGHGQRHRLVAHDSPRIAMTRSLGKRLSQIDKIRDKALETGDLDLLDLADQLELRARRKHDEMMARIDQRQELGKPGVGPPVLMPEIEPTPDPDAPEIDPPSDSDLPADGETPIDPDLMDESLPDSETDTESQAQEETDSTQG